MSVLFHTEFQIKVIFWINNKNKNLHLIMMDDYNYFFHVFKINFNVRCEKEIGILTGMIRPSPGTPFSCISSMSAFNSTKYWPFCKCSFYKCWALNQSYNFFLQAYFILYSHSHFLQHFFSIGIFRFFLHWLKTAMARTIGHKVQNWLNPKSWRSLSWNKNKRKNVETIPGPGTK